MISTGVDFSTFAKAEQWTVYIKEEVDRVKKDPERFNGWLGMALKLEGKGLEDRHIVALSEALKEAGESVFIIDLKNNVFGDEGAKAFAEALKVNQYIGKHRLFSTGVINLVHNPNIGYKGYKALYKVLDETSRDLSSMRMNPSRELMDKLSSLEVVRAVIMKDSENRRNNSDCVLS